jgi:hypothetical protein
VTEHRRAPRPRVAGRPRPASVDTRSGIGGPSAGPAGASELTDLLLAAIGSVANPRSCRYVAGPLTTGPEYYEQLAAGDLDADAIRMAGEQRIRELVERLRRQSAMPVVDPGLLRVSDWSNKVYGDFFLRVLERFGAEVWLAENWEFSTGATKEYLFAVERAIPCFDALGRPVLPGQATQLIGQAAERVRRLGIQTDLFDRRLSALAGIRSALAPAETTAIPRGNSVAYFEQ